ncbi:cellulose synthase operon protein YhjQ/BcsQ [Sphingobium estronivorans]|uniref:cellulose synthase operon protein YhjQ/BcsQ n=1 Tax=Sphingobium estronivorans TaxID=1577690 RepID=UPI001238E713|nr:cellulose synthase operon protein YhjQ/BcsQ [Sphingobium estronivorans]
MPLILCHSPKGGTGNSFVAAHVAMHLARNGHDAVALDFTYQDALKLYFGLLPSQTLAEFRSGGGGGLAVAGVELSSAYQLARDRDFVAALREGRTPFSGRKIHVADVAAGDRETKDLLLPHALLQICTLLPQPASLASLGKIQADTPAVELPRTVFVLNQLDDTHRFSRHTHIFLRELLGDRLIGTIRRDEAVNEAAAMFEPIGKYAPASAALSDVAQVAKRIEARAGLEAEADRIS